MLPHPYKHILISALAGLVLYIPQAQAGFTYNSGDLFLGFRQAGNNTSDFVIDLGPASNFRDLNTPITLTLANVNTQLSSIFGNGWATDPNVTFGLFGTTQNTPANSDAARLIYVSEPRNSNIPTAGSFNTQATPANNIVSLALYYQNLSSPVSGGAVGSPSDSNSFSTRVANSFGSGTNLGVIAGSITNGLDLFRLPPGGTVTNEGSLRYLSGDSFSFTVVPEPSSALLLGLGAVGLLNRRRRQTARP